MAYLHTEDVVFDPCSLVHHVFDGDSHFGEGGGQFGDTPGSVRDGDGELDQPAVGGQTPVQASTQDGGVNVSTAQRDHHSMNIRQNAQFRVCVFPWKSKFLEYKCPPPCLENEITVGSN